MAGCDALAGGRVRTIEAILDVSRGLACTAQYSVAGRLLPDRCDPSRKSKQGLEIRLVIEHVFDASAKGADPEERGKRNGCEEVLLYRT